MGRPWQGGTRREHTGKNVRKKKGRMTSNFNVDTSMEEFDDDIDKFHKGSDKIQLDVNDDLELSEEDAEEPVFNLKAESSDDDDDVESDDDDLDEEQLSGLAAKMAKQAKILRQKTSLMEDEEEDEEGEERKEKKAPWGKQKKMYYSADNVDYELQSSDEEAPAEEEAEALRLQRLKAESLRPEDFDFIEEDDVGGSLEENERTLQEVVERREAKGIEENKRTLSKRGRIGVSSEDANIFVEEVKKDVSALSKDEQMNVVMSDAPELVGLLAELREGWDELHNKVKPLLVKVKGGNTASKEGLWFLETKHMLLLCYCQSILFYLLMKAEGRSIRDHPVIARLVEIRTLLEKLQPVDKKLQNQIDKLLSFPMGCPLEFESKKSISNELNDKPSLERCGLQMAEQNERPLMQPVVSQSYLLKGGENTEDPKGALPNRQGIRNNPAKKSDKGIILTEAQASINPFQQGKPHALIQSDEDNALPSNKSLHRVISTKVQKRKHIVSGDMDLPLKEDLGKRRTKFEMRKVPFHDDKDDTDEQGGFQLDEDEFYQEAKRLKAAKEAAKDAKYTKTKTIEPVVEEEVGKRHISYQMEKNKGLTPHRKKLTKNPRKKYKLKHQKAVIRRKGQVREIKLPSGSYGGESTGIRTQISRSVRFHS